MAMTAVAVSGAIQGYRSQPENFPAVETRIAGVFP